MSQSDAAAPPSADDARPLPPATFSFLVLSLRTQTELYLGLMRLDQSGEPPELDLAAARHSIDMLAMLQEKTRGNLTLEEQRLVDNSLTELRFRYVQVMGERSAGQGA